MIYSNKYIAVLMRITFMMFCHWARF